jgi:hypothetical protein
MPHFTGKASHHFKKGLNFSGNAFKKNRNLYKSLNFSEIVFKMPRILKIKKASPPLVSLNRNVWIWITTALRDFLNSKKDLLMVTPYTITNRNTVQQ